MQKHDGQKVRILSDDERPLVFGKDGHLEYLDRDEHEELIRKRSEEYDG